MGGDHQPLEILPADGPDAHFQFQVGDDRAEVGVAAPLAVTVDGSLDLAGTEADRLQGVGHGQLGVVMGVDADGRAGQPVEHRLDRHGYIGGQGAAVGVAEDQPGGPGLMGGPEGLQGVLRVVLVAVEEVLGVEDDLIDALLQVADAVGDQFEISLQGNAQGRGGVQVPGLAEDGYDRGLGGEQGGQVGVLLRGGLGQVGGAEGRQLGVFKGVALDDVEEFLVGGVGAGPARLDVVDAQSVEPVRDADLVLGCQVQFLCLCSVPKRGVVYGDFSHFLSSGSPSCKWKAS